MNLRKYYRDIVAALVILIYHSHFLIFGKKTFITIHDNLDSSHVWYKIAASGITGIFDFSSRVPVAMNGLMQSSLPSKFSAHLFLYRVLDPFWAYAFMSLIISVVAYCGMKALLKNHFSRSPNDELLIFLVAIIFALLPFWVPGGLSIAGQPLLLNAFLNMRYRRRIKDFLAVIMFCLFSSFFFSGIFILALIGAFYFYRFFFCQEVNKTMLAGVGVFLFFSIINSAQLIYDMFYLKGFVSHRVEFSRPEYSSIEWLKFTTKLIVRGQYHAESLHQYILAVTGISLLVNSCAKNFKTIKPIVGLLTLIGLISIVSTISYTSIYSSVLPQIKAFNLRMYVLFPLLWYVTLFLALKNLPQKMFLAVIVIFLILQFELLFSKSHFMNEYNKSRISYSRFYAVDEFEKIKAAIPEYENISFITIGFHPVIAVFNGLKTLDFYSVNYDLSYKKKFREIIEPELAKSEQLRQYYDDWGSRAYVLVDELFKNCKFLCTKEAGSITVNLNIHAAVNLGARYLISSVEIANCKQNKLQLLTHNMSSNNSPWNLYLYSIVP